MLKIHDVFKQVEESERMELFFDANEEVDADEVPDFIEKLVETISPIHILKVDIDALFQWKELDEVPLRTSAILTIINLMLPQFNLTDYIPYA